MGIERAVSQLSFAEKRLLIIISLTQQLNQATNDFGRTIESPANQTRILNEQWKRLTRAVGNLFLPILAKILPYLNAILMVLTEIINLVASLFGFNIKDFDYGVAGTSDAFLDMQDSIDGASESAKKLKSGLRGFDKLNVISTPSSGSSGGGAGGGIDPKIQEAFNNAFKKYNDMLKEVNMKANKIRDAILDWLGFTDGSYRNLKLIAGVLGIIVGYKLIKRIQGIITGSSLLGKILGTGGLYKALTKLIEPIKILGAKDGLKYIFLVAKDAVTKFLPVFGGISLIIGGIVRGIQGIKDLLDDTKGKFEGIIKVIEGIALIVGGVSVLIGAWPVAIGAGIVALVAFITEAVVKNWDVIKEFFVNVYESFKEKIISPIMKFLTPIANVIYKLAIKPVIDFFKPVLETAIAIGTAIYENIKEIVVGVGKAIWSIVEKVIEIGAKIVEIFIALGKAFYTYVLKPIAEVLGKTAIWIYNNVIKPIFNFFSTVATWIYNNVISPIWNNILWVRDKIFNIFKTIGVAIADFIGGLIKSVINGTLNIIEKNINRFIKMLNKAIKIINKIPGVNITTVQELKIPRLEKGMDFVPRDFYGPVFLDYGERVLTKQENREYSQQREMLSSNSSPNNNNMSLNPTFIIQVGSKEVARTVLTDLQDMAKSNGKPITIQG